MSSSEPSVVFQLGVCAPRVVGTVGPGGLSEFRAAWQLEMPNTPLACLPFSECPPEVRHLARLADQERRNLRLPFVLPSSSATWRATVARVASSAGTSARRVATSRTATRRSGGR